MDRNVKDGARIHKKKLRAEYFDDVMNRVKKFEIRVERNDTKYQTGDLMILVEEEFNYGSHLGERQKYHLTGRKLLVDVTSVLRKGDLESLPDEYQNLIGCNGVILSISPIAVFHTHEGHFHWDMLESVESSETVKPSEDVFTVTPSGFFADEYGMVFKGDDYSHGAINQWLGADGYIGKKTTDGTYWLTLSNYEDILLQAGDQVLNISGLVYVVPKGGEVRYPVQYDEGELNRNRIEFPKPREVVKSVAIWNSLGLESSYNKDLSPMCKITHIGGNMFTLYTYKKWGASQDFECTLLMYDKIRVYNDNSVEVWRDGYKLITI